MCSDINIDGFLAIAACLDFPKPPNYKKLYESKKIAKYLECSPRTDSEQKVKRFFIKDFCKEFHIIGEIKHFNCSRVGLNGSGSISICEWLTLHMAKLDSEDSIPSHDEIEVTEFCSHKVGIRFPRNKWKEKGKLVEREEGKLRVEPLRKGILEIEATNKDGVSIKLLLVKRNLIRTPPEKLGNCDAWIKDLQNVLAAPRRPQKLIFSQISTQVPNCEIIHMENLFGLPVNLTVAFGYESSYDPLDYQVERIDGSTYRLRGFQGKKFDITFGSNHESEEEGFSCESRDGKFICSYGAIEIITSNEGKGSYSCHSNGNYAKGLVYVNGNAALFNYSISPAKYIFE